VVFGAAAVLSGGVCLRLGTFLGDVADVQLPVGCEEKLLVFVLVGVEFFEVDLLRNEMLVLVSVGTALCSAAGYREDYVFLLVVRVIESLDIAVTEELAPVCAAGQWL